VVKRRTKVALCRGQEVGKRASQNKQTLEKTLFPDSVQQFLETQE